MLSLVRIHVEAEAATDRLDGLVLLVRMLAFKLRG